ncbi:MAG: hypothetical protein UU73_C0001G0184 [Candidatus Daviesbacteria bacterium GW2011_GWA1_41_61]|nr:MAG: hypothetical protein UU26_C0006G0022 [Candidatus Daviesbacteria bacterium GW2011_GWC1_40_9]KKR93003.1 MAG: hypothetical protein UU44_C0004G0185 [Candidatus Daviesbacteria bacterium GW2011_GWB1_41_15]KKS15547.1 MAG: hypothetical protein UU73_C0001G0184 [Candidatus Daviesbacteria bacterium GW2011_GWA1_41_61]
MSSLISFFKRNTTEYFFTIIGVFLGWRIILSLVAFLAVAIVPLGSTDRFLGGGVENYLLAPLFYGWANFDGEHYLSISIFGYKNLEQAFFPLYPKLIDLLSSPFYSDIFSAIFSSTLIGLLISHLAFLMSLVLLYKLVRIDYSQKISLWTVLLLLSFPTSFYFASLYNESLFLFLAVASFYFARKKRWLLSALMAIFASTTRVFGILLLPALALEAYQQKAALSKSFWLLFIPLGLLSYMYYQWTSVGDPLAFYNLQTLVGPQHQQGLILFPQVVYRYIKMLLTLETANPLYQTVVLEFLTGVTFFLLPIYGFFKKIRLSYLLFALSGLLLPTLPGSFSSLPRYVIILFPSFLLLALFITNIPKLFRYLIMLFFLGGLLVETALFLRGYWVA